MPIVVMKFGGSCFVDKEAFGKILKITKIYSEVKKIYIASALNGITDLLLKTASFLDDNKEIDKNMALIEKRHLNIIEQIFREDSENYLNAKDWLDDKLSELEDTFSDIKEFGLEPYYKDYILSFGEILSTYILNQYLLNNDYDSEFIPANKLIITDDKFNNAYPLFDLTNFRIKNLLLPFLENPNKDTIVCITGFIGRNKMGYITTLGRGGSDYSASIVARSLYEVGNDKDIKLPEHLEKEFLSRIRSDYKP
ncbi:MAG: hypothetical protein ACFFG0_36450, partial [Candidatus Thorarchaeota archaeon]